MYPLSPDVSVPPSLLSEFSAVTYQEWQDLVQSELKGAPFEKKMFSTTYEGVTLRPLYTSEDGEKVRHATSLPGFFPFVRGTRAGGYLARPWEISQEIKASSPAEFNDTAHSGLQRGLTALNIVLDQATLN